MAVPKKRTSKRRKGMRRSHHALQYNTAVTICKGCGAVKISHHLCEHCGQYRGMQILPVRDEASSEEDSSDISES